MTDSEILKWVNFAKGGPGSGAQPGHAFNGNQWGQGGSNNHSAADLRAIANNHLAAARDAENLRESVLSPENLHRDGEATPAQVARGRALGAALGKEYDAHTQAAQAHFQAADSADWLNDAAEMAGASDASVGQQGEYAEANENYQDDADAAAAATEKALAASAAAGR